MNGRVLAAAVLLGRIGTAAEETASLVNHPDIVSAMRAAWRESRNGKIGTEAAFRLDGNASEYEVIPAPFTGETMQQKMQIIPGRTFAIFHVHPAACAPAPSLEDRSIADKYRLTIVTMHSNGLFAYDPAEKKIIKLKRGLEWIESPKTAGEAVQAFRSRP